MREGTITLTAPPLFVDAWETRMRAACVELKHASEVVSARYRCNPMQEPTKKEMNRMLNAKDVVQRLVGEVGE